MEENTDVFDLLPEPDKKDEEEEKYVDNICCILIVKMKMKVKKQNMKKQRERKKFAELSILKGLLKLFRLFTQVSTFNHQTILFTILVSLAVSSCSAKGALNNNRIIKNLL